MLSLFFVFFCLIFVLLNAEPKTIGQNIVIPSSNTLNNLYDANYCGPVMVPPPMRDRPPHRGLRPLLFTSRGGEEHLNRGGAGSPFHGLR